MSPRMLILVVVAVVVCGAILLFLSILIIQESKGMLAFDRRLAVPRGLARSAAPAPQERRSGGRPLRTAGVALLRAGSMLVPVGAGEREKLAGVLRRAGFQQRDALSLYLCAKLVASAAAGIGAGFAASGSSVLGQHGFLVALAATGGLIVGGIVPEYVLRFLGARRERRMSAALPDALDLMVMCVESGLTFDRALATVAVELAAIEPNLAREFLMMEAELRVGASRRAALQDFLERTELEGLRDLATTLLQSDRYGTPLAQALKNIAAGQRFQRAARIAERAERLPVLMTFPMLMFVVPGTMLLVAGPAFLSALNALRQVGR